MNGVQIYRDALKARWNEAFAQECSFEDYLVNKLYFENIPARQDAGKESRLLDQIKEDLEWRKAYE